jgi:hypothetical protein
VSPSPPSSRFRELLTSIVTVTLYSAEMANRFADQDTVLGKAAPGGRIVKVLYDRLEDIRGGRSAESAFLLGNVIAREIGHLVLPAGTHSNVGLMVPEMNISVAARRPLLFTWEQSEILRRALALATRR